MNFTTLRRGIDFWDRFAPLYEKWVSRGSYHRPVIRDLSLMAEPGWQVLDVGAGTGVLSFVLSSLGCTVNALEPSLGMRAIFELKLSMQGFGKVGFIEAKWEDYLGCEGQHYDLIVACNSLHLTERGIAGGMQKVFSSGARSVCLITEINQDIFIDFKEIHSLQSEYNFLSIRTHRADSSFHFRDKDEVKELQDILEKEVDVGLEDGHLIAKDSTDIAVVWWERKE